MKKYLGSKLTVFCAVVVPLFLCGPCLFGIIALCTELSRATVFLALMGISCSVVWTILLRDIRNQLYSWGTFASNSVKITTAFSKDTTMAYENCRGCGIGFYTHGILNSKAGTKIYFIYLSYDAFDETFRTNINLWKPSKTRIKVQFDKKLYDYLLAVLPRKQAKMLSWDYMKYFSKGTKKTEDGSLP